ncbi:MAG: hypothetical protein BWY65_01545 [Firmicutes bacterium ADurb.Bin373]|nr:MAG: hypothetical protein BWY65_01545 [Firmicutes bacterium ADurb.Bin373]
MKVRGVHGDRIYYDIGAEPTTASAEVTQSPFITKEPLISFICVDSSTSDPHPTGSVKEFMCRAPLRYEQRQSVQGSVMELKAHKDFEIRYTTDGSNPKESGGVYSGEILLPASCKYVRTAVLYKGKVVEEKDIAIDEKPKPGKFKIEDSMPVQYTLHIQKKCGDTEASYSELEKLKKLSGAFIRHFTVIISEKDIPDNYIEVSTANVPYDADNLQATVDLIRETAFAGKDVVVEFDYKTLLFTSGAQFKDWIEMNRFDITAIQKRGTIKQ